VKVYFLLYFFLEVVFTIEVGSYLGGLGMFAEIIVSFILGLFIIKNFKYSVAESLKSLQKGEMSQKDIVSSHVFSLIGAILLMFPGVVSDVLGLLMQIEFVAIFTASKMKFKPRTPQSHQQQGFDSSSQFHYHSSSNYHTNNHSKSSDDIVDVEIVEKPTHNIEQEKK
jgi:2-isopropylmalate synthase/UPF0716 protein FxsA